MTPALLDELLAEADRRLDAGKIDEAERLYSSATQASAPEPAAIHGLGLVAYRRGDAAHAIRLLEQAIALRAAPVFLTNLSVILKSAGQLDAAVTAGERAVEGAPDSLYALDALALSLFYRGDIDRATACWQRALSLAPEWAPAHFGLSLSLLIRGQLARGWKEYEWRHRLPRAKLKTKAPQWNGSQLPGRLLLIGDQGFGDCIQFARYIPLARARCAGVVVECRPELHSLLARIPGVTAVVTEHARIATPDAQSALSSLPAVFETGLHDIPASCPYLSAEPERIAFWRERLDRVLPAGQRRVGLVWAGERRHTEDGRRSIALSMLQPLMTLPGLSFISLQLGPAAAQTTGLRDSLLDPSAELGSFAETAALILNLDLLISVDTSMAHLSGALGKPVWVMLPAVPDWRWMLEREDSPWYPSMRLFRQPQAGDWDCVVNRMRTELAAFASRGGL